MNKIILILSLMIMGLFLVSCGNIAGQAVGGTVFLTCNDSDGGNNMYIPGVVNIVYTTSGKMYPLEYGDRNISATALYESTCKNTTGNSSTNLILPYSKFCPKGIGVTPYFSPITNRILNLSYCKCTDNTQCGAGYTCDNEMCQKPSTSCTPVAATCVAAVVSCSNGVFSVIPKISCATGQTCTNGTCVANVVTSACNYSTFGTMPGTTIGAVSTNSPNSCLKRVVDVNPAVNTFYKYVANIDCVEIYNGVPLVLSTINSTQQLYQQMYLTSFNNLTYNNAYYHAVSNSYKCSNAITAAGINFVSSTSVGKSGFKTIEGMRACIDEVGSKVLLYQAGCTNPTSTCTPSTVANGIVGAYPGCAVNCSYGFALSNGVCVKVACSSNADCPASTFTQSCNVSNNAYSFKNTSYTCTSPGTAQSACSLVNGNGGGYGCPYGCNGNVCAAAPTCTPGHTGKMVCFTTQYKNTYAVPEIQLSNCTKMGNTSSLYVWCGNNDPSSCVDGICCKTAGSECNGNIYNNYTTNICNNPINKTILYSYNCLNYVDYNSGRSMTCGNVTSFGPYFQCEDVCVPGDISYRCNYGSTSIVKSTCSSNHGWKYNSSSTSCPGNSTCTYVGNTTWGSPVSVCK